MNASKATQEAITNDWVTVNHRYPQIGISEIVTIGQFVEEGRLLGDYAKVYFFNLDSETGRSGLMQIDSIAIEHRKNDPDLFILRHKSGYEVKGSNGMRLWLVK